MNMKKLSPLELKNFTKALVKEGVIFKIMEGMNIKLIASHNVARNEPLIVLNRKSLKLKPEEQDDVASSLHLKREVEKTEKMGRNKKLVMGTALTISTVEISSKIASLINHLSFLCHRGRGEGEKKFNAVMDKIGGLSEYRREMLLESWHTAIGEIKFIVERMEGMPLTSKGDSAEGKGEVSAEGNENEKGSSQEGSGSTAKGKGSDGSEGEVSAKGNENEKGSSQEGSGSTAKGKGSDGSEGEVSAKGNGKGSSQEGSGGSTAKGKDSGGSDFDGGSTAKAKGSGGSDSEGPISFKDMVIKVVEWLLGGF